MKGLWDVRNESWKVKVGFWMCESWRWRWRNEFEKVDFWEVMKNEFEEVDLEWWEMNESLIIDGWWFEEKRMRGSEKGRYKRVWGKKEGKN